MPDISVSEHINSLLTAYQYAEKIYSQAASDAIAAEIRRDEAKKVRDELLVRLENGRQKYTPNGTSPRAGGSPLRGRTPPRPVRKNGDGVARRKPIPQHLSKRKVANKEATEQLVPAEAPKNPTGNAAKVESAPVVSAAAISPDIVLSSLADNRDNDAMRKEVPQQPSPRKMTIKEATEKSVSTNAAPEILPSSTAADTSDGVAKRKQTPQHQSTRKVPIKETTEQPVPTEAPKTPPGNAEKVEVATVVSAATISSDILLSPTAGSKKAPKIFLNPTGTPRKRASRAVSLMPLQGDAKPILGIAPGRTRDWYEKNFDCDSDGLVKKFYQAAFGTKTNEKTHAVTVKTVVLNDEWNEFVNDTSQIQEMYIGKSKEKDGKPNPRDKAAEALVNPPQKEPIALFFAPKKSQDSGLVFYGGHWKVIDGKMLNPPRAVKGQTRQWLVKFAFVGVDQSILNALDKAPE